MADNTNWDRGNQKIAQGRDGGRLSGATNQRDMNQGSKQSSGNFANDRERAREAGRKGGSR